MSGPVFGTDRLVIRAWTEDDAPFVFDMYARWEVARWLGAQPRTLGSRDEAVAAIQRWRSRSGKPPFGIWAITERSSGDPKGTVLLVPLPSSSDDPARDAPAGGAPLRGAPDTSASVGPDNPDPVEIGWHLHPAAWGHGYAAEAGAAAARHGFEAGLDQVFAVVRPDNTRSLAVCRRLGMTPLGRTSRWYGTELEAFRLDATQRPAYYGTEPR